MIRKRIICLLILFSLLFTAAAQAESENAEIGFSLENDGEELRFSTTILPEGPFLLGRPEDLPATELFSLIRPELLPGLLSDFREAVIDRNQENAKTEKGAFAGDLFEFAGERESLTLKAADLETLAAEISSRMRDPEPSGSALTDAGTAEAAEHLMKLLAGQAAEAETTVFLNTYDQGRYFTANLVSEGKTVMTMSADQAEENTCRLAVGRGAGNAAYYELITCDTDETGIRYVFRLFRTRTPSLRTAGIDDCVLSAEIRFANITDESFDFEGTIRTSQLPSAAKVSGSRIAGEDGKGKISGSLTFERQNDGSAVFLRAILLQLLQP